LTEALELAPFLSPSLPLLTVADVELNSVPTFWPVRIPLVTSSGNALLLDSQAIVKESPFPRNSFRSILVSFGEAAVVALYAGRVLLNGSNLPLDIDI